MLSLCLRSIQWTKFFYLILQAIHAEINGLPWINITVKWMISLVPSEARGGKQEKPLLRSLELKKLWQGAASWQPTRLKSLMWWILVCSESLGISHSSGCARLLAVETSDSVQRAWCKTVSCLLTLGHHSRHKRAGQKIWWEKTKCINAMEIHFSTSLGLRNSASLYINRWLAGSFAPHFLWRSLP